MKAVHRVRSVLFPLGVLTLLLGSLLPTAQAQQNHSKVRFTAAQANAIALKRFHGTVVGKTTLENDKDQWQYEVTVRSGKTLRDIAVNAMTGRIDSATIKSAAKEHGMEAGSARTMRVNSGNARK